jgi:hypothetical protein
VAVVPQSWSQESVTGSVAAPAAMPTRRRAARAARSRRARFTWGLLEGRDGQAELHGVNRELEVATTAGPADAELQAGFRGVLGLEHEVVGLLTAGVELAGH